MAKSIEFNPQLSNVYLDVVTLLERAVKSTLGPAGKLVLLDQPYGPPKMTKDGVSVVKAIELSDTLQNTIASFVKTAATHTVDAAGDGTTTAIVLCANIFKIALRGASLGANTVKISKGINDAVAVIVEVLNKLKTEIKNDPDRIRQVAIVAANGDQKIGELITQAFEKIGNDGVINVEEGKTREHELKIVEGMQFDRGYISSHFSTNTQKMIAELDNPLILIFDKKISSVQTILPALKIAHDKGRALLIIAEDVDGEAVTTMILNKLRGLLQVVAVKSPGFGDRRKDVCQDIAILTGATVISDELGQKLENITENEFGSARKVVVTANDTTIIEGCGSKDLLNNRVEQIKGQIKEATSDYDKEKLQERCAKLTGGVALLKIGGATEEAAKECKDRVDDAVQAVKAAIEEGIVPGGTVSLLYAREEILKRFKDASTTESYIGCRAVYDAIEKLLEAILDNAGRKDLAVILRDIKKAQQNGDLNFGYDVRNDCLCDMLKAGIVDPVKVVRSALQNAASVASMMLVSGVSIVEMPKDDKNDMGGMPMG